MYQLYTLGFAGIAVFFSAVAADAGCNIQTYDRTAPRAIKSDVDNHFAHFEWASDVDEDHGLIWIWNYIFNEHDDAGLGATWEKAGIRIPITNPLPPKSVFCNKYLVASVRKQPDTNAPIIYGTNSRTQSAAVFVAEDTKTASSSINSSVADRQGKIRNIFVNIVTSPTADGVIFFLERSPGLTVAFPALAKSLSTKQFEVFQSRLSEQKAIVTMAPYSKVSGKDAFKAFAQLYSKDEALALAKEEQIFIGGAAIVKTQIPGKETKKFVAEMIVFNNEYEPMFATQVRLLLPTLQ